MKKNFFWTMKYSYFYLFTILSTEHVPNPEEEIDGILEIQEEIKPRGNDIEQTDNDFVQPDLHNVF